MGAPVFNPHRYTLEEGGMKQTDDAQLAFKREADPARSPQSGQDDRLGRSLSFDYRGGKTYLFPGLSAAAPA